MYLRQSFSQGSDLPCVRRLCVVGRAYVWLDGPMLHVGGMGDNILQCPNASTVADFKKAAQDGDIFFQAFPR